MGPTEIVIATFARPGPTGRQASGPPLLKKASLGERAPEP
ncbi:hypothetical protein DGo_PB0523 (plasmid) [Deinococcus gobiensis I-0]|uniref:Uncharacterized protein n=1 Tax=Deinococcus gobiensis (strain DSM 21396 / JCM 16679 / CGMCC 1.7299 / I-0) TaxID=745776 RepID=H8H2P5_DEIGI|nr:hypothetical protein DGo_PB0523 [Deinococcus gobiensis I-0]